jgi:hypothetical protein
LHLADFILYAGMVLGVGCQFQAPAALNDTSTKFTEAAPPGAAAQAARNEHAWVFPVVGRQAGDLHVIELTEPLPDDDRDMRARLDSLA